MPLNRTPKLRENLNLFYYNVFRFERFTQYLISAPVLGFLRLVGLGDTMARRSGKPDWDEYILEILNNPKDGFSLISTRNHIAILLTVLALSILDIVSGLLRLGLHTFWFYGAIGAGILAFAVSYYVAPTDRNKYLKDFKRFESWPKPRKRKFAFATFLIIIGTWAVFIASSAYYLQSTLAP